MPSMSMYFQGPISIFAMACVILVLALLAKGPRKKLTCTTCQHTHETEAALPKRYCGDCHSQYKVEVIRKTSSARIVGLTAFALLMILDIWIAYGTWEQWQEMVKHMPPTAR